MARFFAVRSQCEFRGWRQLAELRVSRATPARCARGYIIRARTREVAVWWIRRNTDADIAVLHKLEQIRAKRRASYTPHPFGVLCTS